MNFILIGYLSNAEMAEKSIMSKQEKKKQYILFSWVFALHKIKSQKNKKLLNNI